MKYRKYRYLPKLYGGGSWRKLGDGVKLVADSALSTVGLNNVIKDDNYNSRSMADASKTGEQIGKWGARIASNFVPGLGLAVGAVQDGLGALNSEDEDRIRRANLAQGNLDGSNGYIGNAVSSSSAKNMSSLNSSNTASAGIGLAGGLASGITGGFGEGGFDFKSIGNAISQGANAFQNSDYNQMNGNNNSVGAISQIGNILGNFDYSGLKGLGFKDGVNSFLDNNGIDMNFFDSTKKYAYGGMLNVDGNGDPIPMSKMNVPVLPQDYLISDLNKTENRRRYNRRHIRPDDLYGKFYHYDGSNADPRDAYYQTLGDKIKSAFVNKNVPKNVAGSRQKTVFNNHTQDLSFGNGGNLKQYGYGGSYKKYMDGGMLESTDELKQYEGARHEQGGIPIDQNGVPTDRNQAVAEVEGKETKIDDYVFSDRNKVPGTKKTFAEVSKEIETRYADEIEDGDKIALKSRNLELEELKAKQEEVNAVIEQEKMAQQQAMMDMQQMQGGVDPNMMQNPMMMDSTQNSLPMMNTGGPIPLDADQSFQTTNPFVNTYQETPMFDDYVDPEETYVVGSQMDEEYIKPEANVSLDNTSFINNNLVDENSSNPQGLFDDRVNPMGLISSLAPNIADLSRKKDKPNVYEDLNSEKINLQRLKNDARKQAAVASAVNRENARQMGGAGLTSSIVGNANLASNLGSQLNNIDMQEISKNNQIENQDRAYNNRLRMSEDIADRQDEARFGDVRSSAMHNASEKILGFTRDKKLYEKENLKNQTYINALNEYSKYWDINVQAILDGKQSILSRKDANGNEVVYIKDNETGYETYPDKKNLETQAYENQTTSKKKLNTEVDPNLLNTRSNSNESNNSTNLSNTNSSNNTALQNSTEEELIDKTLENKKNEDNYLENTEVNTEVENTETNTEIEKTQVNTYETKSNEVKSNETKSRDLAAENKKQEDLLRNSEITYGGKSGDDTYGLTKYKDYDFQYYLNSKEQVKQGVDKRGKLATYWGGGQPKKGLKTDLGEKVYDGLSDGQQVMMRMQHVNIGWDPRVTILLASGVIKPSERKKYLKDYNMTTTKYNDNKAKFKNIDDQKMFDQWVDLYANTEPNDIGFQKQYKRRAEDVAKAYGYKLTDEQLNKFNTGSENKKPHNHSEQVIYDDDFVETNIKDFYGRPVKVNSKILNNFNQAVNDLKSKNIDLKIADSYVRPDVKKAAKDLYDKQLAEFNKKGFYVNKDGKTVKKAPPKQAGTKSFHTHGQAIDLNQKEHNPNNEEFKQIAESLTRAGFKQHPNEWWHWSIGEFID